MQKQKKNPANCWGEEGIRGPNGNGKNTVKIKSKIKKKSQLEPLWVFQAIKSLLQLFHSVFVAAEQHRGHINEGRGRVPITIF